MSFSVSPQLLEQWVLQSAHPGPEQGQATSLLQQWTTSTNDSDAATFFFQLLHSQHEQVVFYALSTLGRVDLNASERKELRAYLLASSFRSGFLRNKTASLLVQHILLDAPEIWTSMGQDLLQLASVSQELFLKTVELLIEELVTNAADRGDVRRIKELLKGYGNSARSDESTLLERLFESVGRVLAFSLQSSDKNIATLAIKTVKAFFVWTEVVFLGQTNAAHVLELMLLALQMNVTSVQIGSLEAWQEWITSASTNNHESSIQSDQNPKLPILIALLERIHESNLLPVSGESSADIEVVIGIGKLVNVVGLEIAPVWEQSQTRTHCPVNILFNQTVDLFFRAFAYDDIDVSTAVLSFAGRLTQLMDGDCSGDGDDVRLHLPQILNVLYRQLKHPDDFNYNYEDNDDAEEELYRSELCKLYVKLVRTAPATCSQFLCEATVQVAADMVAAPTPDVEATLRLIYHYCEGIRPPPGLKTVMRDETFCNLIVSLHNSNLESHPHREVICLYYDTGVRYYPIFEREEYTSFLAKVLRMMTGPSGLQHVHPRVRSRCCYLLLRLVKSVPKLLRPYVETAVTGIQGLLSNSSFQVRSEDKLYLFETMGILLGKTSLDDNLQVQYLTELMTPHVREIDQTLTFSSVSRNQEHYGEPLSGSIAAIAHLSKGVSKPSPEVQVILMQTVVVTGRVLEAMPQSEPVRNKSMVLLQRMILCVGEKILPEIPKFLYLLINNCTVEDVLFVSQLFNQLCIKFKANAVPAIDVSLVPFLNKCRSLVPQHEGDADSGIPPHLRTEQLSIEKLSFSVLHHIVTYNATATLTTTANLGSLESVLRTVCDGAIYVVDPVIKRTCTKIFRELAEQWILPNANGELYRRGFISYTCQVVVPGMLQSLLDPSFDERDALQVRNVTEFSHLLMSIKSNNDAMSILHQTLTMNSNGRTTIMTAFMEVFAVASNAAEVEKSMMAVLARVKARENPAK